MNQVFLQDHGQMLKGHPYKLFKQFASREVSQHYFSHRVAANWNSLPSSIVEAQSIVEFKRLFDNWNNYIMYLV